MASFAPKPQYTVPALFACILALSALLIHFRELPETSVWKGWRVLAYPEDLRERAITDALEVEGIREYASSGNSSVTVPKGTSLPERYLETQNSLRQAWFVGDDTRYLYLRDRSDLGRKVADALTPLTPDWSLETGEAFYPAMMVLPFLLWLAAFGFSKNRQIALAALAPALLLPYSLNRWPGLAGAALIVLSAHFASEYFPRGRLADPGLRPAERVARAPFFVASLALFAAVLPFTAFTGAIRVFGALAVYGLSLRFARDVRRLVLSVLEAARTHPRFEPVKMVPSSPRVPAGTALRAFAIALLAVGAGVAGQSVGGKAIGKSLGELPIPVPTRYNDSNGFGLEAFDAFMANRDEDGLPDLGDFVALRWNVDTFAWRRLQDPVEVPGKGSVVRYTEYGIGEDGKITGTPKTMLTFDSAFIRRALSAESTPLERLLMDQGRFVSVKMTRMSR